VPVALPADVPDFSTRCLVVCCSSVLLALRPFSAQHVPHGLHHATLHRMHRRDLLVHLLFARLAVARVGL
jgi:hypothetical protein